MIWPDNQGGAVASGLNPRYTFGHFVIGRSNDAAAVVASAVASAPGRAYNPFFLHGDTGLGKTHLMHAIAHTALERRPHCKVTCIPAQQFVNELTRAIQFDDMETF